MAVSTHFQAEISIVDPTKTLVFMVDPTYDVFEWSYSGLTIRGGTDLACEYGAAELMEQMGFRWYIPETVANPHFTIRPTTIRTNLSKPRQIFWFDNTTLFLVYGHSFGDLWYLSRDLLNNSQSKWATLNGWRQSAYPAGARWPEIINANIPFFQQHPKLIRGANALSASKFNLGAAVTISNASPGVVTYANISQNTHGLSINEPVTFSLDYSIYDTGNLPTPLVTGTTYYVSATGFTTTTFSISATPGGAAINTTSDGSGTIILDIPAADMELLEVLCAAHMLKSGLTEWRRTSLEPSDGDMHTSDQVFPFAKRVVDKMRAGTAAMPPEGAWAGIPAQTGVPDCQVGCYAYAGHKRPPTVSVKPGTYVQVALAFNQTGLTYQELIEGHGATADSVALREYLDTQVWSHSLPFTGKKDGYFNVYDTYKELGASAMNTEFAANWFMNMVMVRCGIKKLRTGLYSFAEATDDIVRDVFNNDPAVHEILTLWNAPGEAYHIYNIRKCYDIVNAMQESWYKEYFKYYLVILFKEIHLPLQTNKADQPFVWFSPKTAEVTFTGNTPIVVNWAAHGLPAGTPVTFSVVGTTPVTITTTGTVDLPVIAVINWAAHGLPVGTQITLTTAGVLPAPFVPSAAYYIAAENYTANSFCVSVKPTDPLVKTTSSGSGVHYAGVLPLGIMNGSCVSSVDTVYYVGAAGLTADSFRIVDRQDDGVDINTTSAGSGTFTCRSRWPLICPKWKPSTEYNVGDWVFCDNWKYYECLVPGTSAPAPATGPVGQVQTDQIDGEVTWRYSRGGQQVGQMPSITKVPCMPGMEDDPYEIAFQSIMSNVIAIRELNILHSYAWMRQEANTNVSGVDRHYPWLRMGQTVNINDPAVVKQGVYYPPPDWYQHAALPTEQEWLDSYETIISETLRDEALDSPELVIVRGVTPVVPATAPATKILTRYAASYIFIGPGRVTKTNCTDTGQLTSSSVTTTETYGTGIHSVKVSSPHLVSCQGGELFLDTFPVVFLYSDGTGLARWLYIPQRFDGIVDLRATSRVRFYDADGQVNISPESEEDPLVANLGPGVVKMDNTNTVGNFYNDSVNRYLSLKPNVVLTTDIFAQEDFPNRPRINVV